VVVLDVDVGDPGVRVGPVVLDSLERAEAVGRVAVRGLSLTGLSSPVPIRGPEKYGAPARTEKKLKRKPTENSGRFRGLGATELAACRLLRC
jgi:hypothetical protein